MIIVGLIIGYMISFGEIVRVALFHLLWKLSYLFLHLAGLHESNVAIIGSLLGLSALVHTCLNFWVYNERMNELTWIGMGLNVLGTVVIKSGSGTLF